MSTSSPQEILRDVLPEGVPEDILNLAGVDEVRVRKINRPWVLSKPERGVEYGLILRDGRGRPFVYWMATSPAVAVFERDHPGQEVLAGLMVDHHHGPDKRTILYFMKPREGFGVEEIRKECYGLCPAALR